MEINNEKMLNNAFELNVVAFCNETQKLPGQ